MPRVTEVKRCGQRGSAARCPRGLKSEAILTENSTLVLGPRWMKTGSRNLCKAVGLGRACWVPLHRPHSPTVSVPGCAVCHRLGEHISHSKPPGRNHTKTCDLGGGRPGCACDIAVPRCIPGGPMLTWNWGLIILLAFCHA